MPASDFVPYYRRVIAHIREQIATGAWPPGHKLPSTRELLDLYQPMYGVNSATTIRHAVLMLIETGELHGHQGKGVYVPDPPPPARPRRRPRGGRA